jgi:hypothetical protein
MTLMEVGRSNGEIARLTGIPRGTIANWRRGQCIAYHRRRQHADSHWRPKHEELYCYLLGIYLGDGCVNASTGGAASLVVTLDSAYPGIVAEVEQARDEVFFPARSRRSFRKEGRLTIVRGSDPALPYAFPQHGPGRKHERRIQLTPWQQELTHTYPELLIRGLIHSDGCRTVNRFKTKLPSGRAAEYAYPRYFFSNLSADIRRIFCDHCDLLDVRWTQSNPRNISVSHRRSVGVLDRHVGPKA